MNLLKFDNVTIIAVTILRIADSIADSSLASTLDVRWIPAVLTNYVVFGVDFLFIAMHAHGLIALSSLKAFLTVVFSLMHYIILGTLFALSFSRS